MIDSPFTTLFETQNFDVAWYLLLWKHPMSNFRYVEPEYGGGRAQAAFQFERSEALLELERQYQLGNRSLPPEATMDDVRRHYLALKGIIHRKN